MFRKILLTLLTLLVVLCICLSVILIPGMALLVSGAASQGAVQPGSGPGQPVFDLPTLPDDQESLPQAVRAQMDEIQRQVIGLRGLNPTEALKRDLLTNDQLRQQVINDFFKDYSAEEAAQDVLLLSAFGYLEPGYDLYQLYIDLYSEQIAGYYDPELKEMYVIQGDSFSGIERMTYAHEYTHALQDQHYDLQNGLQINDDYCQTASEYCSAVRALVEGDATLSELLWFTQFGTDADRQDIQDFYLTFNSPIFDAAPAYLKEDFMFPYVKGQEFVQSLYDQGGWAAVDNAYLERPQSTEQILHPDLYPLETPVEVTLPDLADLLGETWQELDSNVLGEWYTYLLLSHGWAEDARQSADQGRLAAAGWAGDAYAVYAYPADADPADGKLVLTQHWLWDKNQDVDEFWRVFSQYAASRWGTPDLKNAGRMQWQDTRDGWVTVSRHDMSVFWVIAPDAALTDSILQVLIPNQ